MNNIMALLSGSFVGFTLGLIGGGGSIVATPLLLYAVGLSPHMAIGTGALAVSANAFVNFAGHARAGNVRWNVAAIFAITGVAGALLGSTLGKAVDGQRLILLFAVMMVVISTYLLPVVSRGTVWVLLRETQSAPAVQLAASLTLLGRTLVVVFLPMVMVIIVDDGW